MELNETAFMTTRDGVDLLVRRLVTSDAAVLQDFNAALLPETRRKFDPHTYDDVTVSKLLKRSENGDDYLLGAFDGDCLVGYFFLWFARERNPLLGIGMLDDYHGRGLGRQMMQLLIDYAMAEGSAGIKLTTMQDNRRAFALYQKMGFQYYGEVENVSGDGRVVVERGMFYPIKPGANPIAEKRASPV